MTEMNKNFETKILDLTKQVHKYQEVVEESQRDLKSERNSNNS
jgi:hypothetical protein